MRLNFRLLLIFSINFITTKVSFANSDTSKAVIYVHANITNDSNTVFYLVSASSKVLNDSIKSDMNGNAMFAVTVKTSDKCYFIGQKESTTNRISWFLTIILDPSDTVKLDLTKKSLIEIIEFVPNKGISYYRFVNGLERITKERDTLIRKLHANVISDYDSAVVNFTFPYIDSIMDIDPFVGLELAQAYHHSLFQSYYYSIGYIEEFYQKLDKIVAKDSSFNANPIMLWLNKQ